MQLVDRDTMTDRDDSTIQITDRAKGKPPGSKSPRFPHVTKYRYRLRGTDLRSAAQREAKPSDAYKQ